MNFSMTTHAATIAQSPLSRFLFTDRRTAGLWLILRVYIGWQWLLAGYEKVVNSAWIGEHAGTAISGFLNGALQKTSGTHPDVAGWYAWFIEHVVMPHTVFFSYLISVGELLTGIALIIGACTGVAAMAGACMNLNYLFAGTVSINPLMLLIEIFLILAWRVAGWYGLDHYLLTALGTPWHPGTIFQSKRAKA